MATVKPTCEIEQGNSLIVQEILEQLLSRVNKARDYHAANLADTDEGRKRAAFIHWSEAAAEARGFLDCLMTLNVLSEEDEAAWYEYLAGHTDVAPTGSNS